MRLFMHTFDSEQTGEESMDQNKELIQQLRALQVHLEEAHSLEEKIASSEKRIREGTSDKYFYFSAKPVEEAQHRREACISENRRKAEYKAEHKTKILKKTRIILVALLLLAVSCIILANTPKGNEVPSWFIGFFVAGTYACIIYWIVTAVIIKKLKRSKNIEFTKAQKDWIAEGARMDQETIKQNQLAHKAARDASYKDQLELIGDLKKELPENRKRLAQVQAAIAAADIVGNSDKNAETIGFLIHQIANRRANSVQEALLQYDSQKAAKEEQQRRLAHMQFMYDLQRQADGQRQLAEAEAQLRQTLHNVEMQKQARRANDELERIRRELESSN